MRFRSNGTTWTLAGAGGTCLPARGKSKPLDHSRVDELLARINTEPLRRPAAATVALVVFHTGETPAPPCRVRFAAAFPTTAPKPVTVRDDCGTIVSSGIVRETVTTEGSNLPAGKILWSLVLEFALPDGLPPRTARAFAASYEESPTPQEMPALPLRDDLPVYETPCHTGDLPTTFSLTLPETAS